MNPIARRVRFALLTFEEHAENGDRRRTVPHTYGSPRRTLCALALGLCAGLLSAQSKLPAPKLDPVFDLHLQLSKPIDVGQTGSAGLRRVVNVLGGTLEGTSSGTPLKGKIMPGADYQIIRPDGFTEIDAHYVIQMESGDLIYVTNRGMRHGPPELLAKLNAGEAIDQSKIYFRTIISVETAAKTLAWMSRSILVSMGERQPGEAIIHVYRLN